MLVRIFVSYSHQDHAYLEKNSLMGCLQGLEKDGAHFWVDTRIQPGWEWNANIEREIRRADIVLALVSVHYLDSPYCRKEIELCLELQKQRGLLIVPVILSPAPADEYPWLQAIETIPKLPRSILANYADEGERTTLFMDIRRALRRHIERIQEPLISIPPEFDGTDEDSIGRDEDEEQLVDWIRSGQHRTMLLHGEPGVGKTTLAVRLLRKVHVGGGFQRLAFRSLRNPVPVDELIKDLITFIVANEAPSPASLGDLNSTFFNLLRGERRVLLVLDNIESVFENAGSNTEYNEEFRDYEYFFRLLGTPHRACILFTSKPNLTDLLRGPSSFHVHGVESNYGAELLRKKGVVSASRSEDNYRKVVDYCGGNPTALEMMGRYIHRLGGELDTFVDDMPRSAPAVVEGLLHSELERLGDAQKELMTWIALERGPVSRRQLRTDVVRSETFPDRSIDSPLQSLLDHHLVDVIRPQQAANDNAGQRYVLKPVFSDVLVDWLVKKIAVELAEPQVNHLKHVCRYPLIRAQAASNVQDAQRRFLLIPVAEMLVELAGGAKEAEKALHDALDAMRGLGEQVQAYGPGNIFEIVYHLQSRYNWSFRSFDFSNMAIWQVNFQGKRLEGIDLSSCYFKLCRFTGLFTSIEAIAFQPNGRRWASGDVDGELRVWSTDSGTELFQLKTGGRVRSVAFGPGKRCLLASAGFDKVARLWCLDPEKDNVEPEVLHVLEGHRDWVCSVAFNGTSTLLATGSDDETVRIWNTTTGESVAVLKGQTGCVTAVRFHPTRPILASSGRNSVIDIWDCQDENNVTHLTTITGHTDWVWSLAFSPDGKFLASGGHDNTVKIWETANWSCVRTLRGHRRWVWSVDFSPDSQTVASGSVDNTVQLWSVSDGRRLSCLGEHQSQVWSVAFRPESDWVASSAEDPAIKFWDAHTGKCIRTELGYSTCNRAVAYSPAGYLATGSDDQLVRIWDLEGKVKVVGRHSHWVRSVAFGPDGQTLASGSNDHTVRVWQTWRGQAPVLYGHSARVMSVAFDSSGDLLASGSDDRTIRLWDGRRWVQVGIMDQSDSHQLRVTSLSFIGDGSMLVSGSHDRRVKLWDVSTRRMLSELDIGVRIESVSVHPDRSVIALGCEDGGVWVCSLRDGRLSDPKGLNMSRDWVRSTIFSPDGRKLAFGGDDGYVYMYDTESGVCQSMHYDHPQRVWSIVFLGESGKLASSHQDHTIRIWDVESREIIKCLNCPRPYEGLRIDGVHGLTAAEKARLRMLGAVDEEEV